MNQRMGWPAAIVTLGLLGLLGLMFWRATADMATFTTTWAAAGPILGLVAGGLPGALFGVRAQKAQRNAQARAEMYASRVEPAKAVDMADRAAQLP